MPKIYVDTKIKRDKEISPEPKELKVSSPPPPQVDERILTARPGTRARETNKGVENPILTPLSVS